jgi:hypothetical protein
VMICRRCPSSRHVGDATLLEGVLCDDGVNDV